MQMCISSPSTPQEDPALEEQQAQQLETANLEKKSAKEINCLNMSVKAIRYMPKGQWRALHKALATKANKRKITIQGLIQNFSKPPKKRKTKNKFDSEHSAETN